MEVQHELEAGLLDLPTQLDDERQVLHHTAADILPRRLGGLHEESHTHGVPSELLEELQRFHTVAVDVVVGVAVAFVAGEHGDVAADPSGLLLHLLKREESHAVHLRERVGVEDVPFIHQLEVVLLELDAIREGDVRRFRVFPLVYPEHCLGGEGEGAEQCCE